ncbi:hypothetical protein ACOYR4_15395 [Acidovorax sp. M14]|uniref:hypothetical protein n=1 Tax=Acidovorax sp. M14 TaxID=3411354 RepID=UPI003BF54182
MNIDLLSEKIKRLIEKYGVKFKLERADGSSAGSVIGVIDEEVKRDLNGTISVTKVMFMSGSSKVKPEIGLFVADEKNTFRIGLVETVRPTGRVLIYKVVFDV